MNATTVAAYAVAVVLIALAPGPDMLYIVANAVTGGRRAGVVAAVGMSTGLAVHTALAAFGLGALLAAAPVVLDAVRWAGAGFLLYLAVSTWWASRRAGSATAEPPPPRSLRRVYGMAVLTNLGNPKMIIFFLAFLPQFLTTGPGALSPTVQLLELGLILIGVGIVVDASVGLLAGTMSDLLLRRSAVKRWMDRTAAAIFGALAVRLAFDGH